jgi:hypothetical protein
MGVYDRQIASAQRMIEKYGEVVTWLQRVATGGTAAKPGSTTTTEIAGVRMAFLPIDREYLDTYVSKMKLTDIPTGMVQAFMGQVAFTPTDKDGVRRSNGEVLNIVDDNAIEVYDPNGEGVILYILRFAR